MQDVPLADSELLELEPGEQLTEDHGAGDDHRGSLRMEPGERLALRQRHPGEALELGDDPLEGQEVSMSPEPFVVQEPGVEGGERRHGSGDADRPVGLERGWKQRSGVLGAGLELLGRRRIRSEEPLGQTHRADVDALRSPQHARLADDQLGRTAADVDHEHRAGPAVGRAAKAELCLLLTGEQPRREAVAPLDLPEERLAVLSIAHGARGDEQRALGTRLLNPPTVVGEDVPHPSDRKREEPAPEVDALAQTRDLDAFFDLLDAPVHDVGDEEPGGVRALVDRRDPHDPGYATRMFLFRDKGAMVEPRDALAGRDGPIVVPGQHFVLGTPIAPPFPGGFEKLVVGMGCFWGAERIFWQAPGVYTTAVGYAGGYTPNPTYQEACSGRTGHTEAVLAVFDPSKTSLEEMLRLFWEGHDPTQGMRQGNDMGTQYRSAVLWQDEAQRAAVERSREMYQRELSEAGYGEITTELAQAGPFYYAEDYHQQYLAKNPNGYCGIGGTGVSCPIGLTTSA